MLNLRVSLFTHNPACLKRSQVRRLYYEPTQGVYYQYDDETQEYSVHSRVDLSNSQVGKSRSAFTF